MSPFEGWVYLKHQAREKEERNEVGVFLLPDSSLWELSIS